MARPAPEWSLDAAAATGVGRRTALRFKRHHRDVKLETIEASRRAYDERRVRLIDTGADSAELCHRRRALSRNSGRLDR
ncbi:MAG TPA: hypothetical protein VN231_10800 [Allosphingosinicella sp.]|nr:hypothetical protein [Allosphingosinicella sp.]